MNTSLIFHYFMKQLLHLYFHKIFWLAFFIDLFFYRMGSITPCLTLLLYSVLGPVVAPERLQAELYNLLWYFLYLGFEISVNTCSKNCFSFINHYVVKICQSADPTFIYLPKYYISLYDFFLKKRREIHWW